MPKGKTIPDGEGQLYGFSDEEWKSFHKSKRSRILLRKAADYLEDFKIKTQKEKEQAKKYANRQEL